MGTLTMLNEMGDLTITWDADKNEEMAKVIEKRMKEGVRFFQVNPFSGKEYEVKTLDDVRANELRIKDEDIERMLTSGKVGIVKFVNTDNANTLDTVRAITDPKEVANTDTVAVRPMRAG